MRIAAIALLSTLVLGGAVMAQPDPGAERRPGPPGGGPGGPPRGPEDRMGPPLGRGGPGGPGERFGPPPGMGGPGAGLHIPPPEAFERLGLSEAQRAKLDALRDGERRRAIRADAEMRLAEMDLLERVESEPPDTTAIDGAIARLMAMRTAQLKARAEAIVAMRAVLTPAQRAKLRRPDPDARWH